jgi:hypothetical protein
MKRKKRKIQRKDDKDLSRRRAGSVSTQKPSGQLQTSPLHRHAAGLPNHPTSLARRQSAILQMQRQHGNAYVQRYLAGQNGTGKSRPPALQRQNQKGKGTGGSKAGSGKSKDWLSGKIYDVVKDELGEAKLKKHAESLAETAAKSLAEQVQGSRTEAEFLKKAQTKLMSQHLKMEIQKTVTELLNSPEGQKLRGKILEIAKTEPGVVLWAIMTAMAAAVVADAPAKLDLSGKLGNSGLKWATKADFGRLQALSLNAVKASLSQSGKEAGASVSFEYKGKQEKPGGETEPAQATTTASINFKEGKIDTDMGPVTSRKPIALESKLILSQNPAGALAIRIGDKKNFLSSQMKIDASGKTTFEFSQLRTVGAAALLTTFTTGPKATGAHKLTLTEPMDVQNLKITANIKYTLKDPTVTAAGINLNYKLIDKKNSPIPVLFIGLEGEFKAGSQGKPQKFHGLAVIQGRF